MTAGSLSGEVMVSFYAAASCLSRLPLPGRPCRSASVSRPNEPTRPSSGSSSGAYYGRTAVIGACCIILVVLLRDHGSWWLSRIILLGPRSSLTSAAS